MKIEDTNCVVVEKDGRILLVKRANIVFRGWWAIPGGHAEKGETMHEAAQREAMEEVDEVEVEKKPFLVFVHGWPADLHTDKPHRHRCHVFRGRVAGELKAGSDAASLGWFTIEDAKKMRITDFTRTILNHISKNHKN
jgi:ADP-ribose pyrophosphatase YjhB (NUDIX family)